MLWERIKLITFGVVMVVLLIMAGSAQEGVLPQKAPYVINFLAAGYVPDQVQPGQAKPLTVLRLLTREPQSAAEVERRQRELAEAGLPLDLKPWEQLARERYEESGGTGAWHQPWRVRFLEFPDLGSITGSWSVTRMMSGEAPEIMWAQGVPRFASRCHEWFINLTNDAPGATNYLAQPNPYLTPEQQELYPRWMDVFYPDSLETWRAVNDEDLYLVPIDRVEISIFYNKTIFRQAGIEEVDDPDWKGPQTWAEFIDLQQRLAEGLEGTDMFPFLMTAGDQMRLGWMHSILNDMIYAGMFDELNVVDDPDLSSQSVSSQELVRALQTGMIEIGDQRQLEFWRLMLQWQPYWQQGHLSSSTNHFFILGKAAMCLDGSWLVGDLNKDPIVNGPDGFEWGLFFIPRLTTESSPFAVGAPPRGVGGATAIQYAITRETAGPKTPQNDDAKDAVEAIVDYLMFLTVPQHAGPMIAEGQSFVPSIRGAELNPNMAFLEPLLERGGVRFRGAEGLTSRSTSKWWQLTQSLLEGTITIEEAAEELAPAVERGIEEELEANQDRWLWRIDENGENTWEIIPDENSVPARPQSREDWWPSESSDRSETP